MKVKIIAEAGVNHNGDVNIAKELIIAAKNTGCDYVKFQTFKTESIVSPEAKKAAYQIKNTNKDQESQFEMLQKLEFSHDDFKELNEFAKKNEIGFLSTPFDTESADFLNELNMDYFKIGSGDMNNFQLLSQIASFQTPVILSTGMARMDEVRDSIDFLVTSGLKKENVVVLQCNTEYPTPAEDVNLKAMLTMQKEFNVSVGFSDHTEGNECSIAACALGAEFIEKHITLDRSMPGPDHKASADPVQFEQLVRSIRIVEEALGSGIKKPSQSERKNIGIARKSIHIHSDIPEGHVIEESDIVMKRPGDGIAPSRYTEVIGKRANRNLMKNCKLTWQDLADE